MPIRGGDHARLVPKHRDRSPHVLTLTRQPTIRLVSASVTNGIHTNPFHFAGFMTSLTRGPVGKDTWNLRLTLSNDREISCRASGPVWLAADSGPNFHVPHQPRHRASRDIEAPAAQLPPDIAHPTNPPVLLEDATDLRAQRSVSACPIRQSCGIGPFGQMIVIG